MNYADRVSEFDIIEKFITNDIQAVIIHSDRSVGISSFLKTKFHSYKHYYISCKQNGSNLVESIIAQLNLKERKKLQKIANKRYGKYESGLIASLFGIIPYVGKTAETIIKGKTSLDICAINYSSFIASILPVFLKDTANNSKICFLIDDAQYLAINDCEIILNLTSLHNIHFIFAITEENSEFYKLESNLLAKKVKREKYEFPKPNAGLVIELSKILGKKISLEEANMVLSKYNNNIYKIRNYLLDEDLSYTMLNSLEKSIICICSIIPFSISEKTLLDILFSSSIVIVDMEKYKTSVKKIIQMHVIENVNNNIHILSLNHPIVKETCDNKTDLIFYKQVIYNYFSTKNNLNLNELTMVYELSKEYDRLKYTHWVDALILMKIKNNLGIGQDLLQQLKFTNNSNLKIVVYAYTRDYSKALSEIRKLIKKQELDFPLYKLYSVLLNRCRHHKKAEVALRQCLEKENNNIIAAYLISNYIHQEKLDEAKEFYISYLENDHCKDDLGYLYRNAASIFWDDQYNFEQALRTFDETNDKFGYYTTLCNYAIRQTINNEYIKSKKMFIEAEKNLMYFGEANLHILYNDFGIYYLKNNDSMKARKYFELAFNFAKNRMPKIFIKINQACLEVKLGNIREAKKIIDSLDEDVKKEKVNRIKQKYYINKLLIYYANNQNLTQLIRDAQNNPERYDNKYTYERINFYANNVKENIKYKLIDWEYCYCPCYLEYWYINPLKLFAKGTSNNF